MINHIHQCHPCHHRHNQCCHRHITVAPFVPGFPQLLSFDFIESTCTWDFLFKILLFKILYLYLYLYLYFSDTYCVHHHHTMYLSGLSNFVQVLVPILKIYLRLIPEKLVELSNLIKMQTIYQIWSKCKQVGSSYAKIYSLAPARVQLNYCYTRECQGTKQFRRVISYSRVLMQGLFIPV